MLVQLFETGVTLSKAWGETLDNMYADTEKYTIHCDTYYSMCMRAQSQRWWKMHNASWKHSLEIKSIYDIRYEWTGDDVPDSYPY